VWYTVRKIIFL